MLQFLSFTWTLSLTKDMDVTGKTAQGMEWSRAEGRKRPDRPAYERNGDLVIRKTSGQVLQQNNYFNKVFSFVEKRVTWTYCGEEGYFSLLSLQPCWPLFVMHSHLHPFLHSIPTAVSSLHPSLPSQILLLCSLLGVLLPLSPPMIDPIFNIWSAASEPKKLYQHCICQPQMTTLLGCFIPHTAVSSFTSTDGKLPRACTRLDLSSQHPSQKTAHI